MLPEKRVHYERAFPFNTVCFFVNPRAYLICTLFIAACFLTLGPWMNAPAALIAGCVFAQFLGNPFPKQSVKVSSFLLKAAVIGLGFGINVHTALKAGKDGFWLTLASIVLILVFGALAGRLLGMPRRLAYLVASGTAICGGSAIAAIGPAVRASAQEMSVALGVVFLLNAVALLIFPVIGHALDMDQYHFGVWSAIAIHDTSSVVGAASAYGEDALEIATTVKLARALWIIPLTFISVLLFKEGEGKIQLPLFILGFVLAMLANSFLDLPEGLVNAVVLASKASLSLCLFLIGSVLNLSAIRAVGWRPLALGIVLWLVCSLLSLPAVLLFV